MFLFDVKDFRRYSTYAVPVTEETMVAALEEAGVKFDQPLAIRFRVKDLDIRNLGVKVEMLDALALEFRINLYVPGLADGAEPASQGTYEKYLRTMNSLLRHQLSHIAHARTEGGTGDQTPETLEAWEKEANHHAQYGTIDLIPHLGEVPA